MKYKGSEVRKNIVCCRCRGTKYMCWKWWNKLSATMYDIVENEKFLFLITGLILVNAAIAATYHYNEGPKWERMQNMANDIFTLIFLFEMIFRMIGLGFKAYFRDGFNIFDFLIVLTSCTEWFISIINTIRGNKKQPSLFIVLRTFRMVRIFKIVRSWTSFQNILSTTANSLQ